MAEDALPNNMGNRTKFDSRVFEQFNHLDGRVERLERQVGHIGSDMAGLSAEVRGIATQLSSIAERITEGSATPWGVLGTWSAVLITLIGSIGYLAISPMRENTQTLRAAIAEYGQREREDRSDITSMNAMLADISSRKKELHSKVDAHLIDGHPLRVEQKLDSLEKTVENIRTHRWSEEDRPQWERIKTLEREIYGKEMTSTKIIQNNDHGSDE